MQRLKLDPIAYLLIVGVLGVQIYSTFLRGRGVDDIIASSDKTYRAAVYDSSDNKGVMHQIFRQNEVDRELLKLVLQRCGQ